MYRILILVFIVMSSCKMANKNAETEQKIIGEWFYVEENDLHPLTHFNEHGFTFGPNNTLGFKI
jgi:hypothetical protein